MAPHGFARSPDQYSSTAGGYAFAINGVDSTTAENQLVIGGILNFSGTSLNAANSVFDYNDGGGQTLLAQSFSSGSVSAPDSFGRITINLTPSSSTVGRTWTDRLRPWTVTQFNCSRVKRHPQCRSRRNSSRAGIQHRAVQRQQCRQQQLRARQPGPGYKWSRLSRRLFQPLLSDGSASGDLAFNDIFNTSGKGNTFSGATYAVDPTGRVVITNVVPSNLSNITLSFILYLDGNGNGVVLGADNIQQTTGPCLSAERPCRLRR